MFGQYRLVSKEGGYAVLKQPAIDHPVSYKQYQTIWKDSPSTGKDMTQSSPNKWTQFLQANKGKHLSSTQIKDLYQASKTETQPIQVQPTTAEIVVQPIPIETQTDIPPITIEEVNDLDNDLSPFVSDMKIKMLEPIKKPKKIKPKTAEIEVQTEPKIKHKKTKPQTAEIEVQTEPKIKKPLRLKPKTTEIEVQTEPKIKHKTAEMEIQTEPYEITRLEEIQPYVQPAPAPAPISSKPRSDPNRLVKCALCGEILPKTNISYHLKKKTHHVEGPIKNYIQELD